MQICQKACINVSTKMRSGTMTIYLKETVQSYISIATSLGTGYVKKWWPAKKNLHAITHSFSTGQIFSKRIEITPQIHIRKFEELIAWGEVSCWESFLTSTGCALTQRTLWMSEMIPNKAPVLKPYVLQISWCEFGEWFQSFLRKPDLYKNQEIKSCQDLIFQMIILMKFW